MDSLVAPERIRLLNDASIRPGKYVLYWMQASHRTEENPALTYAVERANAASLPLVVYFGIYPGYPGSNLRHFTFLLEGLSGVSRSLEEIGARAVDLALRLDADDLRERVPGKVILRDSTHLG